MPESLRYVPTDPCLDRLCLDFRTGLSVERPLGGPRPGYCPHRERDELEESLQSACNITIRVSKLEVQSNFKSRIRYSYGNLTQITVPSVFTGCNLIKKISKSKYKKQD